MESLKSRSSNCVTKKELLGKTSGCLILGLKIQNAKSYVIIDVAIPGDCRIRDKEIEKIEKYPNLKRKRQRFWSLKKVKVVPVVVEALGCISNSFSGWVDTLGVTLNVRMVQKSVLLRTTRILRKVFHM